MLLSFELRMRLVELGDLHYVQWKDSYFTNKNGEKMESFELILKSFELKKVVLTLLATVKNAPQYIWYPMSIKVCLLIVIICVWPTFCKCFAIGSWNNTAILYYSIYYFQIPYYNESIFFRTLCHIDRKYMLLRANV